MSGKRPILALAVVALAAIAIPAGHRLDGGLQAAVTSSEVLAAAIIATTPEPPTSPPLRFEENGGQFLPHIRFVARGPGYELALSGLGMEFLVGHAAHGDRSLIGLRFADAGTSPVLIPDGPAGLTERDSDPRHARIRHVEAYEGVDLVVHGHLDAPRYELRLAPGADADRIRMRVSGAAFIEIDDHGNLVLGSPHGTVVHRRPHAWQVRDDERVPVPVRFVIDAGTGDVGFLPEAFDPRASLTIDPIVVIASPAPGRNEERAATEPPGASFDLATHFEDARTATSAAAIHDW